MPQVPPPKQADITSSVMLWTLRGSFEQKLEIAARAGLQSVELVGEHLDWDDAGYRAAQRVARSFRLGMDTLGAMPNWGRMPVSMLDPAQRDAMLAEVGKNIESARKLEIPMLILIGGNTIAGRTYDEQYASLVEGCKRAGDLAAKADVKLIIEPLNNLINHKGHFLASCVEGLKLIREVDNPHVRLLFDIYHEQVQRGNLINLIKEAAAYTEVFHVADSPGRHDPGTGEILYDNVYKAIRDTGYKGYITMEYLPVGDPVASLIRAVDSMRAAL